ncbi:hypothetical protein appser11_16020 [Actinobacillus pleuropneumoniae serovar 11 str. 56153]|nr:hypothetical protein appser9_15900 [Actinobacillus pleuropneumoniae serovar 9 str. CVJ13261]EFM97978.1 hypothetical protein appser11_16020 [Actinobacillus pleuropneumoniae serovar 11 str. 56153]
MRAQPAVAVHPLVFENILTKKTACLRLSPKQAVFFYPKFALT